MRKTAFVLSAHATTVIAERNIDLAWIERALANPIRAEPGVHDPNLVHAFVRVPERGGRVLRVVYNGRVDPPRIVTAYFDRGFKDEP